MNKFILIFLLTSWINLFSQTLKFDVMVKYSISRNGSNSEQSSYGISSDSNYIMRVLNNHDGTRTAHVFDLKSKEKHEFNVLEKKSKDEGFEYTFVYTNTRPFSSYFPHASFLKNIYFDFKKIGVENDIETVRLTFYKNKSKSRVRDTLELKILNTTLNLFPLFRFTCLHPAEVLIELDYGKPGLVTSCISDNGSTKFILKSFEEANLELTLPK